MNGTDAENRPNWMVSHRFIILLLALTLLIASSPVVAELGWHPQVPVVVATLLFCLMLLSAVFAVSRSRRSATLAVWLLIPVMGLQFASLVWNVSGLDVARFFLTLAFLGLTIVLVLAHVFRSRVVTADTICAALCVYILLGVLWATAYSLLFVLSPNAFAYSQSEAGSAVHAQFDQGAFSFALYYSFVTISTLGYGDIVPLSPTARMLATLEAIVGQLYLAVLVAGLVGSHIARDTAPADATRDE